MAKRGVSSFEKLIELTYGFWHTCLGELANLREGMRLQ